MRKNSDFRRIPGIRSLSKIKVFTDGASRGNPGHSGIGVTVYDENDFIIETYKEYLGEGTNNQAEYKALIKSLEVVKKLIADGETEFDEIEFYSDSELMVNQVNFDYRIKEPDLALLNNKFHVMIKKLDKPFSIFYIERAKNKNSDRLANIAIDTKLGKNKVL
jgi:ribonuclease HI